MDNDIRYDKAVKYYQHAKLIANLHSKDKSNKVCALFLMPKTLEILTIGYNGMPRGIDETSPEKWERPMKYFFTEHAERNAIYNAARSGVSLLNSICVVTLFPCCDCARGIIQTGAKMVITLDPFKTNDQNTIERWGDNWNVSLGMLQEANIDIRYVNIDDVMMDHNQIKNIMNGLGKV